MKLLNFLFDKNYVGKFVCSKFLCRGGERGPNTNMNRKWNDRKLFFYFLNYFERKDLEGIQMRSKHFKGHQKTWRNLKGLEMTGNDRTWKDLNNLKGLEFTWKDLKWRERTWRKLKRNARSRKVWQKTGKRQTESTAPLTTIIIQKGVF